MAFSEFFSEDGPSGTGLSFIRLASAACVVNAIAISWYSIFHPNTGDSFQFVLVFLSAGLFPKVFQKFAEWKPTIPKTVLQKPPVKPSPGGSQ